MANGITEMAEQVATALELNAEHFSPHESWADLGVLIEALEGRGCFLMCNSVSHPTLKRMASFHRSTERGYPCVGSSEWGAYATLGEAVLRAAHEALLSPRAQA